MIKEYFCVQLRESLKVGLPLEHTAEVISLSRGEICPIPGVASSLLGVVNQRGRLLWVLELSDLLQLAPPVMRSRPQDRLTLLLMTQDENSTLGKSQPQLACVVSALQGIVSLNPDKFQLVPTNSRFKVFVSGITEIEQSSVAILNPKAIFAELQSSIFSNSLIHQ